MGTCVCLYLVIFLPVCISLHPSLFPSSDLAIPPSFSRWKCTTIRIIIQGASPQLHAYYQNSHHIIMIQIKAMPRPSHVKKGKKKNPSNLKEKGVGLWFNWRSQRELIDVVVYFLGFNWWIPVLIGNISFSPWIVVKRSRPFSGPRARAARVQLIMWAVSPALFTASLPN